MKIQAVPFGTIDWDTITPAKHPGISGEAYWKEFYTKVKELLKMHQAK